jgi:hypothetical protein
VALGTEELIAAFLACTLPKWEWTHEAHLRVGLWHLLHHGADEALALLRDRIRRYNEASGVVNTDHAGYHETITRFYVWVIDRFLQSADRHRTVDQLAEDLLQRWGIGVSLCATTAASGSSRSWPVASGSGQTWQRWNSCLVRSTV